KVSRCKGCLDCIGLFLPLPRPAWYDWSTLASGVALTKAATLVAALDARQVGRPERLGTPQLVLAHGWQRLAGEELSPLRQALACWPCIRDYGMGETTIRFSTSLTPGANQAVSSAAFFSA